MWMCTYVVHTTRRRKYSLFANITFLKYEFEPIDDLVNADEMRKNIIQIRGHLQIIVYFAFWLVDQYDVSRVIG